MGSYAGQSLRESRKRLNGRSGAQTIGNMIMVYAACARVDITNITRSHGTDTSQRYGAGITNAA